MRNSDHLTVTDLVVYRFDMYIPPIIVINVFECLPLIYPLIWHFITLSSVRLQCRSTWTNYHGDLLTL